MKEHIISLSPVDVAIRTLAVDAAIDEYGLPMTNEEKEAFRVRCAQTVEQTKGFLKPSAQVLADGLRYFINRQPSESARQVASKIERAVKEGDGKAIYALKAHDFDALMEPAMDAYEQEDWDGARSMLSAIAWVFPMRAAVYVLLATLEWRTSGPANALKIYDALTKCLEDPILDYHAADCFAHCGDKDRAHQLLLRAEDHCRSMPAGANEAILDAIMALRDTLNHMPRSRHGD